LRIGKGRQSLKIGGAPLKEKMQIVCGGAVALANWAICIFPHRHLSSKICAQIFISKCLYNSLVLPLPFHQIVAGGLLTFF